MSSLRCTFIALLVTSGFSIARADDNKPKWTPPQQAFDVCAKAKQGDPCSFKGRHDRDMHGTCEVPKDGGKALVCRPQMHHGGGAGSGSGSGSGSAH